MRQSTSTRLLTRLAWMLALAVSGTTAAFAQEAAPEELKVFDADLGPAFIDVHSYPPEYQAIYPTFAQRCSKCHTLARPINSSMTGDEWWSYVTRMSGKPGSGISPSTAEEIFRFLSYDSQVRARSTNAVDPTLAPFLAVSKELSGVARIAAGTKNVPTEPPLRLRLEGDRRLNLKDLFRDDGGQKLSRWTARAPNQAELLVDPVDALSGNPPRSTAAAPSAAVSTALGEAIGTETDPEEKVDLILDWLDESIEKAPRAGDASADAVLQDRKGDATEFTRLFCAMTTAAGVPARSRVGLVAQRTSFHFHPWAEVWLGGGWLPVDPYLGQFPADLTHIRLVAEKDDALSAWDATRFPGLDRLKVLVILDEDEQNATGGGSE